MIGFSVPTPKDVVAMDLAQLRQLTPNNFPRFMAQEEIRHIFETCDALWLHSGEPKAPHAELTSGRCSNGFVDVLRVLHYTNLCEIFARQLIMRMDRERPLHPDWVIGSDHASATLSYAIAATLNARHDFTEKGENKAQLWKRFVIQPEEVVLQIEKLITTTGTLQAVRNGIRAGNPTPVRFAPFVLAVIHRSDVFHLEGDPILYLAHYDIRTWAPEDCPLCAAGSERVRPKKNWAKLTGRASSL